jgi:uncharacterized membrane protein
MLKSFNALRILRVILGMLSIIAFIYSGLWPFALIGLILLMMALLKIDYGIGSCEFYRDQSNKTN